MFPFRSKSAVLENASVLIHRPPAAIFDFIGHDFFRNYPRWSPEVQDLRQVSAGPVRLGIRARQVRMDLGHRSESIFAVTAFQPDQHVCFEGVSSQYRCDYVIEGVSSGAEALLCFTFELPSLEIYLRPFESMIRDTVQSGVARTVHNVKRLIEAEPLAKAA